MLNKRCRVMKVKKIGNTVSVVIVFLLSHFSFCGAVPNVALVLTDMNGNPVAIVSTGVPFQAHVLVNDVDEKFSAPVLNGVHNFARGSMSSSTHFTIINGKSSSQRRFSYVLRADHPGVFTLGPAHIHNHNATLESNVVKLEVTTAAPSPTNTQSQPAVLTVEVDKKKVVVGEPVMATITLLHELDVRLNSPLLFDVEKEGFEMGGQPAPVTHYCVVDGKTYASIEQKIELYPREAGTLTIPSISAQCQVPTKRKNSHSGFDFDDFFGRRIELYAAYSSPVTVEVTPLPYTKNKSQAVGEFQHFSAQLERNQARVGEGLVFTVEIEGSGNAKKIEFPKLHLPEGLTSYESKSEVVEQEMSWKKRFEYIVQGVRSGNYKIPSQAFTYFDLKSRNYKTLKTEPLPLDISGGTHAVSDEQESIKQVLTIENPKAQSDILPLVAEKQSVLDTVPKLPMNYFYYLRFLLLFLVVGIPRLMKLRTASPEKKAFKRARALVKMYKKQNDTTKLYQLMITLFAERTASTTAAINEQTILYRLRSEGASQQLIESWTRDLARLAQAAYTHDGGDKKELFEIADHWINEFEKIV